MHESAAAQPAKYQLRLSTDSVNFYFFVIFRLLLSVIFAFCISTLSAQDAAQSTRPITALRISGHSINAEVADDDVERATGLMFRDSLEPDNGMLFIMPQIAPVAFHMKNTRIPLSIAFLDSEGIIVEIHDMQPFSKEIIRSVFSRIAYALEMPQGWFTKNNIWPGERVEGVPPLPK